MPAFRRRTSALFNAFGGPAALSISIIVTLAIAACGDRTGDGRTSVDDYDSTVIISMRAEKDAAFRQPDSPIDSSARSGFKGLLYYPVNRAFAVSVPLEVFPEPHEVKVAATGGDVRMMTRYGRFIFNLLGTPCSLTVFKSDVNAPHLFVPFKDPTNGFQTYEVGRYIDLEEHGSDRPYLLDFNRSYNPYCAYNESFTCPIVPEENTLAVSIAAGEKAPAGH